MHRDSACRPWNFEFFEKLDTWYIRRPDSELFILRCGVESGSSELVTRDLGKIMDNCEWA